MTTTTIPAELEAYWKQLDCGFPRVEPVFADCMRDALATLSPRGVDAYIENARFLGKMGRGAEPILIFLEKWPAVAKALGEDALPAVMECVRKMWKSPNGNAIVPFLQSLPATARKLQSTELLRGYLDIVLDFMERTTGSIHGIHQTFPSPGLPDFFRQIPLLLGQLSLAGLKNWVEYGVRYYKDHPDRQIDYFSMQSADSRAVLQRERHGTLLADNERKLDMYLRGLWHDADHLIPYSNAFDELRKPIPYYDKLGIRLPDVYDDFIPTSPSSPVAVRGEPDITPSHSTRLSKNANQVAGYVEPQSPSTSSGRTVERVLGIDRYRAVLAHIAAGRPPSSPTTSAPSSAWRQNFSRTAAWNIWRCASIPACAAFSRRCILPLPKTPAIPSRNQACAMVWRCCRARSLIRSIRTRIRISSNLRSASTT